MRTTLFVLGASAVVLVQGGCRSSSTAQNTAAVQPDAAPGQPATLTSAPVAETPTLKARMHDHDVHGSALRDAIARADLDAAKREAKILADLRLDGAVEPTWRKNLDAMNAAAAQVADARDLAAASSGLAEVARTCGNCHASLGGPRPVVSEPPGEASGVGPRMKRHQWAAARLWDGLVIPSDDAWTAGARVLTDAPLQPELLTPGKSPVPAIGTLASSVHELGRKASVAKPAIDRAVIYGELMATCASCHQRLGGGGPPAAKQR